MHAKIAKVRARNVAAGQAGRITYAQLILVGLMRSQIEWWIRDGTLTRTRPRVYALGYVRTDLDARIWDALLYAGPGARLTGSSGAHQRELIKYPPRSVVVATPRRCQSVSGIVVLSRRPPGRVLYRRVPVAPLPELMLELAAEGDFNLVRFALANLEFRRQLDIAGLLAVCARGRRGSTLLRRALVQRLPQLARTRSPLEVAFLLLLEAHHLALPEVNVWVHGVLVDMYWRELGLVVELDGGGNHSTAFQKRRDAGYMETLRAHGLRVVRFDWDDVHARVSGTLAALAEAGVVRA